MKGEPVQIYQRSILLLVCFILLSALLFYIPLKLLRVNTIRSLNQQHMTMAHQTSLSIGELFSFYDTLVSTMAEDRDVVEMTPKGKKVMQRFYNLYQDNIKAVTRLNERGIITYTYPYNASALGKDVSYQEHNQKILKNHKAIVSDVFRAVQGYQSVAYAVPVFDKYGKGRGSLTILIPFEVIAQKYLDSIEVETAGRILLLSKSGKILYSSHENHISKSIFNVHSNDALLLGMVTNMISGVTGETVLFDTSLGKKEKSHSIYYPIKLPQNYWSLSIAVPEKNVLSDINRFSLWWSLIFLVFITLLLILVIKMVGRYITTIEEKKRMETEHQLLEKEKLLSQFINNAPIPIIMVRSDGTIEYINQHFEAMYGYGCQDIRTVQEWMERSNIDSEAFKKARAFWEKDLQQALREKLSFKTREKVLKSKDGTNKDTIITYTLIEDRIVISLEDRTILNSLKNKEQELLFKKARVRKMEAIGLMAGGVAHDLNNILSGIVSYPELLLLKLPQSSELRKPIEIIQKSGIRAAQVVSDLLTVARGVASPQQSEWINDIIREQLSSPEIELITQNHPGISIEAHILDEQERKLIRCSKVHVKKSLMNLISNAAEALREGGKIVISSDIYTMSEEESLEHKIDPGQYIVMSVKDNGQGISPDDQEHIFEPFYTKKKMGKSGTGLGLSIVWNTMQDHKGTIKLHSDQNGTLIELLFPVSDEDVILVKSSEKTVDLKGKGQKILVVDDEENQLDITSQILTQMNYQPFQASSGEQALSFLEENEVDLVLLDMIMGEGMNGRETFEKIIKSRPDQKAIIVSGYAHNTEVDEAMKLGVQAYVAKPYSIQQLTKAIRDVLNS